MGWGSWVGMKKRGMITCWSSCGLRERRAVCESQGKVKEFRVKWTIS